METSKAYKYRLYPDSKRQIAINESISLSQKFYNKLLEKSIGKNVSMSALNKYAKEIVKENPEYLKLYSQTRQNIFIRLQKAYQKFFRRCKEKKNGKKITVGFPKFKSYDKYRSITYPQDNGSFSIERIKGFNCLRVSRIGTMKIELHRNIEGKIKTLTIVKEGKEYYAIFSSEQNIKIPKIMDTNPVGIDLGLDSFIALSDGRKIEKPKFFKEKEKRIAHWQRVIARRHKGSRRRQKAKEKLRDEWATINNQSEDFAHKLSHDLVYSGYTSFAIEKLGIQNMQKNHHLAQSISNASWGMFIQFLKYKAQESGLDVIEVNPRNTSMTCNNCGNIQKMPLSERTFNCDRCRLQLDRDVNASINILNRATAGHAGSDAWGDMTSTLQQAGRVASQNREHTLHDVSKMQGKPTPRRISPSHLR